MADHDLVPLTQAEYAKRVNATEAAVASARIEGLTVSPAVLEIMERQNRGEIGTEEAVALVHAYHATL